MLESEFEAHSNLQYCSGVGNCFDLLLLLVRAYDMCLGDEIIAPSNAVIARWLAVSQCGPPPLPAESDPLTHSIIAEFTPAALTP